MLFIASFAMVCMHCDSPYMHMHSIPPITEVIGGIATLHGVLILQYQYRITLQYTYNRYTL